MRKPTLEIERVLWAIKTAQRWDTVILGCDALQNMRQMIEQNRKEMALLKQGQDTTINK